MGTYMDSIFDSQYLQVRLGMSRKPLHMASI